MTLHVLRGSVVTLLFEDGLNDVNVAMRTGNRGLTSPKNYQIEGIPWVCERV